MIGLAVLAIAGCGGKGGGLTAQIEGLTFDSVVIDTATHITADPNSPKCEVSISMQYARGGKLAEIINNELLRSGILTPDYFSLDGQTNLNVKQCVDSFAAEYLKGYIADYKEIYRQDAEHASSFNTFYKVNTSTTSGAEGILTYIARIAYYGGGAHTSHQTIVKNFNVKTGKLITINDLFVKGYEYRLNEVLKSKFMKQYKVDDWKALSDRYFFADGKLYAPDNFIPTDDTITFIYCEDEVAPHAEGEIRVEIDRSDIKDILKK